MPDEPASLDPRTERFSSGRESEREGAEVWRAQVPNVHPHRFRHDTARRLVETVDLPTVAAWLGHERLDTVRIYSQPDEAALERAAAAVESR